MVSDAAVGIVADYPVVATGVEDACRAEGLCVVFKDSFRGALDNVSELRTADALLVDVGHGSGSGPLELCPRLAEVAAPAPLIGFLAYAPVGLAAVALLDTCLAGLISLIDSPVGVARAVRAALAGEAPIRLPKNALRESPLLSIGPVQPRALQPDDVRILQMLVSGLRDGPIGDAIGFGDSAVRHRIERIMHEWGIATRPQLAAWAVLQGLVDASRSLPGVEGDPGQPEP